VVVAIIALLLTILAPCLDRAKDLARLVICLSQTRSISQAAGVHAASHDRRLPMAGMQWGISPYAPAGFDDASESYYTYYTDNGNRWPAPMAAQLGEYMGMSFRTDSREHMIEDVNRPEVETAFGCPALSHPQEGIIQLGPHGGWPHRITEPSAYGFNEGILGHRPHEAPKGRLARIDNSSQTLLSMEVKPWPGKSSLVFFDLGDSTTFFDYWVAVVGTGWGTGVDFYRHSHRMSAVFVDGHTEAIPTGESEDEPAIEAWERIYVLD
jgi:prepilin-type processing-associated H-X9-DG protein